MKPLPPKQLKFKDQNELMSSSRIDIRFWIEICSCSELYHLQQQYSSTTALLDLWPALVHAVLKGGVPMLYCHATHRNPLNCIVPSYMKGQIILNGTEEQRRAALNSLQQDQSVRSLRAQKSLIRQWREPMARRARSLGYAQSWRQVLEAFEPDRTIYDAETNTRLPGRKVRGEGDPESDDIAVNQAYDGLGETFSLFSEEYGRNSIDNEGMGLDATVHYDKNYDNAFWDSRQMVFGDGDIFNEFTSAIDVIGHELTHGVTEHTAGLIYWGQSGALNEHVSDVFGSLVKQRSLGQTVDQADWLIGKELFDGTNLQGVALRSMSQPGTAYDDPLLGKDPQPDHMQRYERTFEDNGGVHINSGICNRAFYLAASNIGGNAWEEAGEVWYETLTARPMPFIQFRGFAWLTVSTASQLFGPDDVVPQAIREAWREVGVLP